MTAFLFPGQGSQYVGMAKDFHDNFKIARSVFDEIEDATSLSLRNIIFENPSNELNLTNFTQISIFATSYAIFKVIETEFDVNKMNIDFMLGHSLGEYTALACSKKINLSDCSKLLKLRGELMNNAVEANKSGMAALIGLSDEKVQNIIKNKELKIQIANDNSIIQVVISGMNSNIEECEQIFLNNGAKKFVKLNVSAAFHSNLMLEAQNKLENYIDNINFLESNINIISNYSAKSSNDNHIIAECLSKQMANKVRWTESIQELNSHNETNLIEIGPSKILSGLVKRINDSFKIISINEINDLKLLK